MEHIEVVEDRRDDLNRCSHCGAYLRDEARFCDICGWPTGPQPDVSPPPPPQDDDELRAVVRQLQPGMPPPPPEQTPAQRTDLGGIIIGIIVVIAGLAMIIIGLSGDLSCGVVKALGGQCYTLLGYTYIEPSFRIVPTILLGFGVLFILVGSITAYRATRE